MRSKNIRIKATIFVVALLSMIHTSALAGATDYYQGKGRIVVSSDGNKHDNDDMLATKLTLMILAKAGLQEATTLYTYADHVWDSESNDLDIMRISAEITGLRFGFSKCKFIAAVENKKQAYEAMCKEIVKSTAEDPLFIVAAGPMEVVGEALRMANNRNAEALNHVTVISHSTWNDRHADEPTSKFNPDDHSGWVWSEMVEAFSDRVNFKHIVDQNRRKMPDGTFEARFQSQTWDDWEWMATHRDPNIRWVRNNAGIKCKPDYSDAGMLYYLCADLDGVRGDENGNIEKLKKWIGTEPIALPEGPNVEPKDFIAFEAESAQIPKDGSWAVHYDGSKKFDQIFGMAPVSNGAYIECVSGPISGGGVKGGVGTLKYTFTPKESGVYYLSARMAQQLIQDGEVSRGDLCNDVYVKMEGDFQSGNDTSIEVLKNWNKYYGRGFNAWGSLLNIEAEHKHSKPVYELKAGEEYTLYISARSKGVCIDYFVLTQEPIALVAKRDIAFTHPYAHPQVNTIVYKSVDFEKISDWGDDFVDAKIDNKRGVLQIADRLKWGAAETEYSGESDKFNIVLNTMLESDGESTFKVYINGKKVGEVTNPCIHATETVDYTIQQYTLTKKPIKIKSGSTIRVEFCSATNGKVPEGKLTATSRGRWRSIHLTK
ncbi:MAG: hypothetical protein SNJ29_07410 [Rikenellaceae bacterium]